MIIPPSKIFLFFILTSVGITMPLNGMHSPCSRENAQESNAVVISITRILNVTKHIRNNLGRNQEQHPEYLFLREQWLPAIKKLLQEHNIIPCIADQIGTFISCDWWDAPPYNLYNYARPYTPDISDLTNDLKHQSINMITNNTYFTHLLRQRLQALQNEQYNTPESWQRFLRKNNELCLTFIKINRKRWQGFLLAYQKRRDLDLYYYQKELIDAQHYKNKVALFAASSTAWASALALRRTQKAHVILREFWGSFVSSIIMGQLTQLLYHKYQLQPHYVTKAYITSRPLHSPWQPQTFPALYLLDTSTFIGIYTLLGLLHTYGSKHIRAQIDSDQWATTVQKIEQWLKSKINHYNSRKKKVINIIQKLKIPFLLRQLPFMAKLAMAVRISRVSIDITPSMQTGVI